MVMSVRDHARSRSWLILIGAQIDLTVSLAAEHRDLAWPVSLSPRSSGVAGMSDVQGTDNYGRILRAVVGRI